MCAQIRKYNHDIPKNVYSDLHMQSLDIDTLCHVLLEACVLRAKKEVWHRLIPKESIPDDLYTNMGHKWNNVFPLMSRISLVELGRRITRYRRINGMCASMRQIFRSQYILMHRLLDSRCINASTIS